MFPSSRRSLVGTLIVVVRRQMEVITVMEIFEFLFIWMQGQLSPSPFVTLRMKTAVRRVRVPVGYSDAAAGIHFSASIIRDCGGLEAACR